MKILFCSPIPTLNPRFGASRVIVDLVEAWREHGWQCDVFPEREDISSFSDYPHLLSKHLEETASRYDVVDFPYNIDPWISNKHSQVIKVARSVLLSEHVQFQPDPTNGNCSLRRIVSSIVHPLRSLERRNYKRRSAINRRNNMRDADLINVANTADRQCLVKIGIPSEKILVLPYGLTHKHADSLRHLSLDRSGSPVVAFLGTFDYRKGCLDFPSLIAAVRTTFPNVIFRLIGTKGQCVNKDDVLRSFPADMRTSIQVIPTFEPEELADLLGDCQFGVFPSYREGFGIGVVEMLTAGLPVVAYDVPGPCDILPPAWLAPRGDVGELAAKLIAMIRQNPDEQADVRAHARVRSSRFDWSEVADRTHYFYSSMLEAKQ